MIAGLVIALAAVGGLTGCAAQLAAQVTAFNQVDDDPGAFAGKRFTIVPSDAQRGSLEFGSYADLVRRALVANGLVDAGADAADLAVALRYGLAAGSAMIGGSVGSSGGIALGGGRGGGVSSASASAFRSAAAPATRSAIAANCGSRSTAKVRAVTMALRRARPTRLARHRPSVRGARGYSKGLRSAKVRRRRSRR
ncbi:MAG: hypothetical protein AB7G13_08335 [Lautropia sp.]